MKIYSLMLVSMILLLLLLPGCTKLKDNLPAPTAAGVHVHPPGWADTASPNFHGIAIANAHYQMQQCQTCHGADFKGGVVYTASDPRTSCYTCHTGVGGPENCSTCHGSSANNAPPRDLDGNYARSAEGVGAHQPHYRGSALASPFGCSNCHHVPGSVYEPGHIDSTGEAKVMFTEGLGSQVSAAGAFAPNPSFDREALTCNNTFCHGNWLLRKSDVPAQLRFAFADSIMKGAAFAPVWNDTTGAPAVCGTCHGLPPAGHFATARTSCVGCHGDVVNAAGTAIVNKSKHINGVVDLTSTFGGPRSF